MTRSNIISGFLDAIYSAKNCDLERKPYSYARLLTDVNKSRYTGKDLQKFIAECSEVKYIEPQIEDFNIFAFNQTWSSTALGFGGIGGAALTTALTVVVEYNQMYCVYFGGRLAYKFKHSEIDVDVFRQDIGKHRMKSVKESANYYLGVHHQDAT